MSKTDTWMPLYIGDYLADTMRLTTIQHGAYLLLLMEYWRQGPLVDDDNELAAIVKMDRKSWDRDVKSAMRRFFVPGDDGLLHQKRIDAERAKASELSDKRRAAVAQRTDRKPNKDDTSGSQGGNNQPTIVEHLNGHEVTIVDQLNTHAGARPSASPSPSPSQVERKKSELRSLSVGDSGFDVFWAAYPRKVGKGHAAKAYATALRKTPASELLSAVEAYQFDSRERFIPHPATWLNGERWLDEQDTFDPALRAAGLSPEDFDLNDYMTIGSA